MTSVSDLYTDLGGSFELYFVMAEVGNLYAKLGVTLSIFIMAEVGNFFYINCNGSNGYY
jgi:hypothetical protein